MFIKNPGFSPTLFISKKFQRKAETEVATAHGKRGIFLLYWRKEVGAGTFTPSDGVKLFRVKFTGAGRGI